MLKRTASLFICLLLSACTGLPDNVQPVSQFEVERYLGRWYEIARLDHSFERGLTKVTADYIQRDDGGIDVINRGYDESHDEMNEARGKAYFVDKTDTGHLKVSFFGPFYGSYVVFELDKENYQYAFVSGPNHKYLWLLARHPKVDPAIITRFKEVAQEKGFDLSELIIL